MHLRDIVDHIEYVLELVGVDYVGLGSDFDGCLKLPEGLDGVDKVPKIRAELVRRGYSNEEIQKIMGLIF